jgi:hypothetical protein
MWIATVLTSEFFWGVIVGLVLSVLGAYCLAVFVARQQRNAQKDLIKNFCIDTVKNLRAIVDDMVNHRQRTQVIHGDYLSLLDIEFNAFSRNREHLIHVPSSVRDDVRKFVNDCAIRRAEIGTNLAQFVNLMALADRLQSQGDAPQANRVRKEQAEVLRNQANQALDQLVTRVSDSVNLVNSFENVR